MTKEIQNPNDEELDLDIRSSSFFRHSCFVISHSLRPRSAEQMPSWFFVFFVDSPDDQPSH